MIAPELRFPQFTDPWREGHAGDAFSNSKAKGKAGLPIWSVTLDRGMVPRSSLDLKLEADASDEKNLRAQPGDLVYNMMRMWQGAVGQATEDCMVSPAYVVLRPKRGTSPAFFDHWFKAPYMLHRLRAYSHGLTKDRLRLYYADFAKIPIKIPAPQEQARIADFMSAVTKKTDLLRREMAIFTALRHGVVQKLFSHSLSFKRTKNDAFPDWDVQALGDLFHPRVETSVDGLPIYSVSQANGMVPRSSLDRDFGGSADTTGYKRAAAGDLVYNTMRMWQGAVAMAPVDCSVSPAYVVLRPAENTVAEFFLHWFKEPQMKHRLWAQSYGLTDDRLRLYYKDFANIRVRVPHPDEQRKIADSLSAIDAKIDAVSAQIALMETFKRGLLQKMFV